MRKYSLLYILLLLSLCLHAQTISVSSFRLLESDLTANTSGTMEKDQNGDVAALIKVVTTQTGYTFDGGALGIVKTIQKPSEVWVYVPKGMKKITISHPQLGILRDYYFPMAVEAARTYEMVLVTGTVETTVHQTRTSQYVVFQLTPSNAVVELNGELLNTVGGTASKMMKFGTYDYRVQAPDHFPEAGKVTIDNPEEKHIVNISLKPNYSKVTFIVDNNAEIWVNGDKKGDGSWSGNLGAGTYEIETKKQGHRSSITTKDIVITEQPQTIQLPAPTPIYGEAEINSSPALADIYIDGNKIGQTPKIISNLLIGEHDLEIKLAGFDPFRQKMQISEQETFVQNIELSPQKGFNDTTKTKGSDNSLGISSDDGKILVNFTCDTPFPYLYIDGEYLDIKWKKGIVNVVKIPTGSHELKVRHKNFKEIKSVIDVNSTNHDFHISFYDKRIYKDTLKPYL